MFFFNDTATTEIYTLSLHDALPILEQPLTGLDETLVVAAQAPVSPDPRECPLHNPTPLEHAKARWDLGRWLIGAAPDAAQARPPMLADRQLPAQRLRQPRLQALVGRVGPDQGEARELCLQPASSKGAPLRSWMSAGCTRALSRLPSVSTKMCRLR